MCVWGVVTPMSMTIVHCLHCGYDIANRNGIPPYRCTRCRKHPTRMSSTKYPIDDLLPGQQKLFPWINLPPPAGRDITRIESRNCALLAAARRRGWRIQLMPTPMGIEVRRIT